jgi:hypothetical protein
MLHPVGFTTEDFKKSQIRDCINLEHGHAVQHAYR